MATEIPAKCNSVKEWRQKCLHGGTDPPYVCGCIFCECTCTSGAMEAPMKCQCAICLPELHTIGYGRKEDEAIIDTHPDIAEIDHDEILRACIARYQYETAGPGLIDTLREETSPRCPYYIYLIQSLKDNVGSDYFEYLDAEYGSGTAKTRINELITERDAVPE